jgi:hypothetical protein
MNIVKEYEVHMNLDANEVYAASDDYILGKIKKFYEGRCYNGTFVTTIRRIVRKSDIYCTKNKNDGSSELDIIFEADAIIYTAGTIIPDCEIKHIDANGQIICALPNVAIRLDVNRMMQTLGPGSKIPVKINQASYSIGKHEISVLGEAYVPPSKPFTYIIYELIGDFNIAKLQPLCDSINSLLENKIDAAFFTDLFSYGKTKNKPKTKSTNLIEVVQSYGTTDKKKQKKYLFRPPTLLQGEVFYVDTLDINKDDKPKYVQENVTLVLHTMLREYLNYLTFIQKYAEIYDTKEKIASNSKVWKLLNHLKTY